MCGIIGYVGNSDASPILIESLKKLEYRGYDSSGVSILDHECQLIVRKAKGKINKLEELITTKTLPFSNVGISHTRWATHGLPTDENAHPHTDNAHHIAVVHNGIIENYAVLKEKLKKQGCRFVSQTDTEVIAHLISTLYKGDLQLAVQKAIAQLHGAFAIGVISKDHPGILIAARVGSPLIIGLGENENYIASDVPAILDRTKRVIYLKDGEMAVLSKSKVDVFTFEGKKVTPKIDTISFTIGSAQKDGYDHFMLKEIHEQPEVLSLMLKTRLPNGKLKLEGLDLSDKVLASVKKVTVIACGTAYHAGLVGKYIIEDLARLTTEVDTSSEFRYRNAIVDKNTLIIAVSQSGETADTLAAVREAKAKGAKVISICNVTGSTLTRESDSVLYTYAGPEMGVASTKAYTAQLMMFYMLGLKLAHVRKSASPARLKKIVKGLQKVPALYKELLKKKTTILKIAEANSHFGCFLFLGRNINYPTALEGALKLKEVSYIPAEGYAAGEMKHGPIALIDEYRAVICVALASHVYEKMISNVQEIRARKGNVIAIATEGDKTIPQHADHVIEVPEVDELLTPLVAIIPLQLIAYYIAVKRGNDVDQPRNLAKSVTVE
jgi:glucosamine--fructose-6-phosphate aminotransferase (isomerizing)